MSLVTLKITGPPPVIVILNQHHRRLRCILLLGAGMRLRCCKCGKSVSNEVPDSTIIRAWFECPECVAIDPKFHALESIAKTSMPPADDDKELPWQRKLYVLRSIARDAIGMEDT